MQQFLINEFGQSLGNKIYDIQQKKLQTILELTTGKSNNQMITLNKTILPRIALYKVLKEELGEQKKAYDTVEKYMLTIVGPKLNKQYSMLKFIPGFFYMFRKIMLNVISKSDNWVTEVIKNDSISVKYNITKCLWYDACVENNCPELCKIFCDVDHVIYGSMKKIKFIRTGTLGTGNNCCDFCFLNRNKINGI
ncbi:L-2-amino-thiazoline-4-carboxylic acid hydrolase [Clostridium acidisoli DSM 12555]|uniref:L-2-amino-thiazoline-4-carboxylic acid hydrolase n=1 Tax=Clostridium acidisoli DSM 12555 TaxID=1121291 RepID=A0A1W1XE91_9CLOT|nr:L-2-amino-thiazoline-4-carboxylic acid hydrolase [Clostridium acidisoli]SMC22207.1 L-2-amino-thiazoline-4-carboxylic acid hydrolase [Clostridium acidisoli DSM 12555]